MEEAESDAYCPAEGKVAITREGFCKTVDSLLDCAPVHVRDFFKDFANDPETTNDDIQEIMDCMLNKIDEDTIAQC